MVDLEAQRWIAEALEGGGACLGAHGRPDRPSRDKEESLREAGSLNPTARRAAQAVMRAATTDPLSDWQLE